MATAGSVTSTDFTGALNALRRLIDSRAAVSPIPDVALQELERLSIGQLRARLREVDGRQARAHVSLYWSMRLVEGETSISELDEALFRFAHHLRVAALIKRLGSPERAALAAASLSAFQASTCPSQLEQSALPNEANAASHSEAWEAELGIPEPLWRRVLRVVERATQTRSRARSERPAVPRWLRIPRGGSLSQRLLALLTEGLDFGEGAPELVDDVELAAAYHAFVSKDFQRAGRLCSNVLASIPGTWVPTPGPDSQKLVSWFRLVYLLAGIREVTERGARWRLSLSALELFRRLGDESLSDQALADLADEAPQDPTQRLQWSVRRARLTLVVGHETALRDLSNADRALLRSLWTVVFTEIEISETRRTIDLVGPIEARYREIATRLYQQSEVSRTPTDEEMRCVGDVRPFLDAAERHVVDDVLDVFRRARSLDQSGIRMPELREIASEAKRVAQNVRDLHSVLVEETTLPIVARLRAWTLDVESALENEASAQLRAQLITDKLPLLALDEEPFELRATVQNVGRAAAKAPAARIECTTLSFDAPDRPLPELAPGAEAMASWTARVNSPSTVAEILVTLEWEDDFEREFSSLERLFAETQRESRWLPADTNPFQLNSISEPERLVGRATYLQAFVDSSRAGGSLQITGLKRVGKTSLVRVGLRLLERVGWVTAYVPLGEVLGPSGDARDIVLGLAEHVEDSVINLYGTAPPLPSFEDSNFSRPASRWLGSLHRQTGEALRVAIAIDDFDELPPRLRSGPDADALFLFLRALVDHSWLSLSIVGSEVLPTILENQAHRLNQVAPFIVGDFGSRTETAELLRLPTANRIDWDDAAVNRAHMMSAGNPYYATLIGGEVWKSLRARSRTLAQESDVDSAVAFLSEESSQSHFLHLWADDPAGFEVSSPRSIRASAILRAVARCSPGVGGLSDRSDVLAAAHAWVPDASDQDLNASCDRLVARQVLQEATGGVRIHVPLVESWLRNAGSRYLDQVYRESALARSARHVISAGDYRRVARELRYLGDDMNELRLQSWVEQLPGAKERYLAFRLLDHLVSVGYFSTTRIQREVIPRLQKRVHETPGGQMIRRSSSGGHVENALVLAHGTPGSSGPTIVGPLCKVLRIPKGCIVSRDEIGQRLETGRYRVVFIFDEFSGTGSQLSLVMDELIESLDQLSFPWKHRSHVVVGVAVSAESRTLLEACDSRGFEMAVGHELGPEVRAFHPDARIFDSDEDRIAARDLFEAIGRGVHPEHPLGWGDMGLLVVFEHNCPNNTLSALWKDGVFQGQPWEGLFSRSR